MGWGGTGRGEAELFLGSLGLAIPWLFPGCRPVSLPLSGDTYLLVVVGGQRVGGRRLRGYGGLGAGIPHSVLRPATTAALLLLLRLLGAMPAPLGRARLLLLQPLLL